MIEITYIADAPIPSKAANCVQVLQVCASLRRAGCAVTLLAPWAAERLTGSAGAAALERRFAVVSPPEIRYVPFVEWRGRFRGSYFVAAVAAARLSGRRFVMTRNARVALLATRVGLNVVLESHMPPNSRASERAYRDVGRSPRLLAWVFISEKLRELCGPYVADEARTMILHDAVDLERFTPIVERADARRRVGVEVEQDARVVLHAGSLYAGRGAEELVSILDRLPVRTELWFVGGREEDVARIRTAVPEASRARVRFFGHRAVGELPCFLFSADVLVLASTSKGTAIDGTNHVDYSSPMKLFEYFAAGRPIVTTALAGVREVVRDGVDALLVPMDDRDAMAAALARVLTDEGLARRLEAGAREAGERNTWSNRARAIVERLETRSAR